ncbi:hypothetical protein [Falsiroseomonas sp. CW058]|uniref:hypothetical protein n=1 Tax=Falsiroseomonas sp. CW058 TaxID=3388664 RepID=UPI003D315526
MSDPFQTSHSTQPPDTGQSATRSPGEDLRAAAAEARAAAAQAASTVAQEATAAAQTLKQQGAEVVQAVQARAEGIAEQGKRSTAEQAEGLARAVHRAAEELEGATPQLASIVHDAAGTIDGMARSLRESSPGDLIQGVQDFARRQPLAFFGAAVLAGFALARFARASNPHRHDEYGGRHDYNEYGGYGDYDAVPASSQGTSYAGGSMGGTGMGSSGMGSSGMGGSSSGGAQTHGAATGAPGWVQDENGTSRPATLASASLGGAAAMQSPSQAPFGSGGRPGDVG